MLFADGSYEGDAWLAAKMAANEFGAQVEQLRIDRLADPILAQDRIDDAVRVNRIRARMQKLSTHANPETIAQFHAQFRIFPEEVLTKTDDDLSVAMKQKIESVDQLIETHERIAQQNQKLLPLARWWATVAECRCPPARARVPRAASIAAVLSATRK